MFVQLEVSLPTRQGRRDILEIHMRTMTERGHVARDVNIDQLAEMAEGFTGAEMEGIVKAGASFALERALSSGNLSWNGVMMERGKYLSPKKNREDCVEIRANNHSLLG